MASEVSKTAVASDLILEASRSTVDFGNSLINFLSYSDKKHPDHIKNPENLSVDSEHSEASEVSKTMEASDLMLETSGTMVDLKHPDHASDFEATVDDSVINDGKQDSSILDSKVAKKRRFEFFRISSENRYCLLNLFYMTVGAYNAIKFPNQIYRDGNAFLLVYFIMMFVACYPMVFGESCLGQFTSAGSNGFWGFSRSMKGLGLAFVVFFIQFGIVYHQVCANILFFIFSSLQTNQWSKKWSDFLRDEAKRMSINTTDSTGIDKVNAIMKDVESSINFDPYALLCLFFSTFFILSCYLKYRGKKVIRDYVLPVASLAAYLLLFIFILKCSAATWKRKAPDFLSKILSIQIWIDATTMVMFKVATFSIVAVLSSYNRFSFDLCGSLLVVPLIDLATSIIFMFLVMGCENKLVDVFEKGGNPIGDVYPSVITHVFLDLDPYQFGIIFFPMVFSSFDSPKIWGSLLYLIIYIYAITAQVCTVESLCAAVQDKYPRMRIYQKRVYCCVSFLLLCLCLPFNASNDFYKLMANFSVGSTAMTVYIIFFTTLSWLYGADNFLDDIEFMRGTTPVLRYIPWRFIRGYLRIMWKYIFPFVMLVLNIASIVNGELSWDQKNIESNMVKFILLFLPILAFLGTLSIQLLTTEGSLKERITFLAKPSTDWGPKDYKLLTHWNKYKSNLQELEASTRARLDTIKNEYHSKKSCIPQEVKK